MNNIDQNAMIKKEGFTWFDDKETYRFFRDEYFRLPAPQKPIGHIRTYQIDRESLLAEDRKKRIKLLSRILGSQYSQKLEYLYFSLQRFLRLAIGINRISSLLSETFFFFERYLYMKLNWEEGKSGFYRDHSLHAANEAYLGYKIIHDFPGLEIEKKFLAFLREDNRITQYIYDNCRISLKDEVLEAVLCRAWFISALFHDLGYVLQFGRDIKDKLLNFHRHSDLISKSPRSSFDDIQLLLGNSLLFQTVENKKLETSYNCNNHGAHSAFLLLATFYSPPAFEKINPVDRVAIEWAARSIFFHDFPEEKKVELKKGKQEKIPFGNYRNYFKKVKGNEIQGHLTKDLAKSIRKRNMNALALWTIKLPENEKEDENNSKRILWNEDPLAFYLRFVDELHVFGRNSLSIDCCTNNCPKNNAGFKESVFSYSMPFARNLVRFPAQAVKLKDRRVLQIYYILDALLAREKIGGKKNPNFDISLKGEDKNWMKFFLNELYWLKQSALESQFCKDIEFYLLEVMPQ